MSQPITYTFHVECKTRDYKARNILTLEDRVAVIREYEQNPVYQRLAEKFNCSSKQIKNIISSKDTILRYHANRLADGSTSEERRERQQKIIFLGKVIYEFIQRTVYHGIEVNAAIVRGKALEVKESIAIMNFYPNSAWMQNFKAQYQLPEFDLMTLRQSMFLDEAKEESFKAVDLIQFVSRREKETEKRQASPALPPKKITRAMDVINGIDEYAHSDEHHELEKSNNNNSNISNSNNSNINGNNNPEIGEPTITYESLNDDNDDYDYMDANENETQSPAEEIVDLDSDTEDYYHQTATVKSMRNKQMLSTQNSTSAEASSLTLPDIASYQEALQHLKVLEEYAMLNYNFRAIGLITQLQQVLKHPPQCEEFMG